MISKGNFGAMREDATVVVVVCAGGEKQERLILVCGANGMEQQYVRGE